MVSDSHHERQPGWPRYPKLSPAAAVLRALLSARSRSWRELREAGLTARAVCDAAVELQADGTPLMVGPDEVALPPREVSA